MSIQYIPDVFGMILLKIHIMESTAFIYSLCVLCRPALSNGEIFLWSFRRKLKISLAAAGKLCYNDFAYVCSQRQAYLSAG